MIRAMGSTASGFRTILHNRPESCVWNVWTYGLKILDMSPAMGRPASEFRPKLHSGAKSLSLESLDMNRAMCRESLDIPKLGHEILIMGATQNPRVLDAIDGEFKKERNESYKVFQ